MDFSLSPDQVELQSLARRIIADACTAEHLVAVGRTDSATDLDLWHRLGEAGLISIGLPEPHGGGLGWLESAIVIAEAGRHAAPIPALAVIASAPSLLAEPSLLDGVASGETIIAAAIHEPVGEVRTPATTARNGRVSGTKLCVNAGLLARRFLVTTADGLYAVEADAAGVALTRSETTSGVPDALLTFDEAPAIRLGGVGANNELIDRRQRRRFE